MAADYGSDISCLGDLDRDLSIVSGSDALLQAVVRRWDTPNRPFDGGLFYDASYGYETRRWINTQANPARIQAGLEAQALLDDRVTGCKVAASLLTRNDEERRRPPIKVTAIVFGDQRDSYPLTVAVSDLTVELLREDSE